jgi:RecB family exonuclease
MALETPLEREDPAPRPAPQPPLSARPTKLSVTRIEKLIRDPYAIYARYILGLQPLRDLIASPDAPMRGLAIHEVLEQFVRDTAKGLPHDPFAHLMSVADKVFAAEVPWPATREMWRAKLKRSAAWFVEKETERRKFSAPLMINGTPALEAKAASNLQNPQFMLDGRIDRIDQLNDGRLVLYDYKTGALPSNDQQKHFNKQLPLLAALVLRGGIAGQTGFQVARTAYIGLSATPKEAAQDYTDAELDEVWDEFAKLIAEYADPDKGYTARRAVFESRFDQDYDQLSRYGEWAQTDKAVAIRVGS